MPLSAPATCPPTPAKQLRHTHVFVHAMVGGQPQVDVTARVHPHPMGMADRPAGQYLPVTVANAHIGWLAIGLLLADVKDAVFVPGDVVWPTHAGPHAD